MMLHWVQPPGPDHENDPTEQLAAECEGLAASNHRLTEALQEAVDDREGWRDRAVVVLEDDGSGADTSSYIDQLEVERDDLLDRIKDLGG